MNEYEKNALRTQTPCNFDSTDEVISAIAEVHTELILIHPFRDGNGRVARLLSTLMALQANIPLLNFEPMTGENRENYYSAIKEGFNGNHKPMESIFRLVIDLTLSEHGKKI